MSRRSVEPEIVYLIVVVLVVLVVLTAQLLAKLRPIAVYRRIVDHAIGMIRLLHLLVRR